MLARRQFLTGLLAAPAVVAASSLMPLRGTRLIIPQLDPRLVMLEALVGVEPSKITAITYHLMEGFKADVNTRIISAGIVGVRAETIPVRIGGRTLSVEWPLHLFPGDELKIMLNGA